MIPGEYSETGPSCGIKLADGPRSLRCLDVDSERAVPGGPLNVYPCYTRWHQMFSFGNGTVAPRGAVHVSLQAHVARELKKKKKEGEEVHRHLCLGVEGSEKLLALLIATSKTSTGLDNEAGAKL